MSNENEAAMAKRGEEKRTERGALQADCFFGGFLKSSVKGEIWRVVVVFLGRICWRSLRTGLSLSLNTQVEVCVVPDVTDVLVFPSSVVTEFCDV